VHARLEGGAEALEAPSGPFARESRGRRARAQDLLGPDAELTGEATLRRGHHGDVRAKDPVGAADRRHLAHRRRLHVVRQLGGAQDGDRGAERGVLHERPQPRVGHEPLGVRRHLVEDRRRTCPPGGGDGLPPPTDATKQRQLVRRNSQRR
jgi:hypothetical protein